MWCFEVAQSATQQQGGTSVATAPASAGQRKRTGTGGRNARRQREVSGSARSGDYISHKPAGAGRGAGVGDLTGQALPGNTKVNAGTAARREE